MQEEVKKYFEENLSWKEGLELFKRIFPNKMAFARQIKRNPSAYNKRRLHHALKAILSESEISEPIAEAPKDETKIPTVQNKQEVSTENVDLRNPEYEKLVKEQTRLFTKKSMLCNSLADFAEHENAERGLVVSEILKIKKEYNRLAVEKKHYQKFGEFPTKEDQEKKELTLLEIKEAIQRANVRKSKHNGNLKRAKTEEKRKHYQQKIAEEEVLLQELKIKRSLLNKSFILQI